MPVWTCLNSQTYHPPHGTPNFMAFPTYEYKLGCDFQHPSSNNNSSSSRPSSRPLQSRSRTSRGWALTGYNFNEVRTRCERGPNEVRNQILGDWPPKLPDRLFGSHTLSHFFQNSKTQELSAVEQKRKPSQAAAAGKSYATKEETKGD